MLIAVRLDAGPDLDGRERKLTLYIDSSGALFDVLSGWPRPGPTVQQGPILRITPEEYELQLQIAMGSGL